MAAVRQQVLNWLYSVLTSEYRDVNRTYNDVAQTLSHYSSLSPRTDVYTYETGASALLLTLSGTLPVTFRGTIYRFPIALWVPHTYPMEPPMVYVTPTEGMMIRPGQHVDPQGKIYHPYLAGWPEFSARSNVVAFLAILRDIFATEPPVIAKRQNAPPQPPPAQIPPPVPPPPPGAGRPTAVPPPAAEQARAPLPPPKPMSNSQSSLAGPSRRESGPPLPPLPSGEAPRYGPQGQQDQNTYVVQRNSRYDSAPPLPQTHPQRQSNIRDPSYNGPVSPISPPNDPSRRMQYSQYQQSPPNTSNPQQPLQQNLPPSYNQQQPYQGQPPQWQQQLSPTQAQPQPKPPPPPDLLDAPLVLAIPSAESTNLPAPPVPPNPEKDILLHNIGTALCSQRQHTRNQTMSSLPGLEAQHQAMLSTLSAMQAEISSLESLNGLLSTNTNILHTALHDADKVIDSSQHRTAPSVDELLVAPTVVANQLYDLVSEERSLGDALFVLGRAVEKGRISPTVFAKMTRSLAREWYLKKALVKKIGRGMGLTSY